MESINYEPIGIIRTQYTETLGMPIQAALAQKSVLAVAEISEQFVEGLTDLTGFSHIILIYHFHKSGKAPLMQKPFLDDQKHGVFSIRSPRRPNPIGISVVELIRIEENRLYFNGADMLDETPLLDIKPFVPQFDHRETDMIGWLKGKF
jgi:tRNA (adenine37-N6)-methyltransferase